MERRARGEWQSGHGRGHGQYDVLNCLYWSRRVEFNGLSDSQCEAHRDAGGQSYFCASRRHIHTDLDFQQRDCLPSQRWLDGRARGQRLAI